MRVVVELSKAVGTRRCEALGRRPVAGGSRDVGGLRGLASRAPVLVFAETCNGPSQVCGAKLSRDPSVSRSGPIESDSSHEPCPPASSTI